MEKSQHIGLMVLGAFLAVGIALGGYFIGQTMYNAKVGLNTAQVKGLAERRVEADLANWTIGFSMVTNSRANVAGLYKVAEDQQGEIIKVLKDNGFEDAEIKAGIIDYAYQELRDDNQILVDQKHILSGSVDLETGKVRQVTKARGDVNKLIAKGINIESRTPQYLFTKLNEIKPDMLKEASQNARVAAKEFAENAGVKVGRISSARQGSFEITDAGENYGNTNKIEKDVRVVTTISFYLTD